MDKSGWIKLHRKIWDDELWNSDEPFDRCRAFIDLLLMANHEDRLVGQQLVRRGEVWTTERNLAKRWHWKRTRVQSTLHTFEQTNKCTRKPATKGTIITIVKYGDYQGQEGDDQPLNQPVNQPLNKPLRKPKNQPKQEVKEEKKERSKETKDSGSAADSVSSPPKRKKYDW